MAKKTPQFRLEEAINKLNEIVARLESGDLALEDGLKLYEEGIKLSNQCNDYLDKAEQKITDLSKGIQDEDA